MSLVGRIHLVMVPSTDHDRSIAFYERLGFEKRADFGFGTDARWVELFPPDGTCGVALSGVAALGAVGVDTGLIVTASGELEATRVGLATAGVDVDSAVARPGGDVAIRVGSADVVGPTPAMFGVRDPDGNGFMMVAAQ
jgi:catechol 2,3-dioxygenase-like lactoylglutathione lyase family enzyme